MCQVDSEKQSNLPRDGTVHSLTSNVSVVVWQNLLILIFLQTMSFIKDLLEYANSLGEIFQGLNSFSLSSGSSESEKKKALGQYLGEWCGEEG